MPKQFGGEYGGNVALIIKDSPQNGGPFLQTLASEHTRNGQPNGKPTKVPLFAPFIGPQAHLREQDIAARVLRTIGNHTIPPPKGSVVIETRDVSTDKGIAIADITT